MNLCRCKFPAIGKFCVSALFLQQSYFDIDIYHDCLRQTHENYGNVNTNIPHCSSLGRFSARFLRSVIQMSYDCFL